MKEKRKGQEAIPSDIETHLNENQLCRLRSIEGFGWQLKFIRRPLFQIPVIAVSNDDGTELDIIDEEGDLKPLLEIRR